MTRPDLDPATATALQDDKIYAVWMLALEIDSDPVYINTGLTNLSFPGGSGYDPPLVGPTFIGSGNVGSIDAITDSRDGSQSLKLSLPGVDLADDYLHQIINNSDLWQMKRAYIWLAVVTESGAVIGKPLRVKTGRIDQLTISIDPDNNTGTLDCTIESQASYNGDATNSKYSDQARIDPNDTSQIFVSWLANQVAQIGTPNAVASGTFGSQYGASSYYGSGSYNNRYG